MLPSSHSNLGAEKARKRDNPLEIEGVIQELLGFPGQGAGGSGLRQRAVRGRRTREYAGILAGTEGLASTLEWNPGNHFVEADRRTARAFLWAIQ